MLYHFLYWATVVNPRWICIAKDVLGQFPKLSNAEYFMRIVRHLPDRQWRKRRMNLGTQLFLVTIEVLHKRVCIIALLNDAIANHPINWIAKKRKVRLSPQRLFDHHTFRIDHRT